MWKLKETSWFNHHSFIRTCLQFNSKYLRLGWGYDKFSFTDQEYITFLSNHKELHKKFSIAVIFWLSSKQIDLVLLILRSDSKRPSLHLSPSVTDSGSLDTMWARSRTSLLGLKKRFLKKRDGHLEITWFLRLEKSLAK